MKQSKKSLKTLKLFKIEPKKGIKYSPDLYRIIARDEEYARDRYGIYDLGSPEPFNFILLDELPPTQENMEWMRVNVSIKDDSGNIRFSLSQYKYENNLVDMWRYFHDYPSKNTNSFEEYIKNMNIQKHLKKSIEELKSDIEEQKKSIIRLEKDIKTTTKISGQFDIKEIRKKKIKKINSTMS